MYQLAPPKTDIMMEHRHLDQRQVCFGANIYINPGEIVFLTADANYTNIYLIDGKKFFLACTLGKVHEKLKDHDYFLRPNRNAIVNLNFLMESNEKFLKVHNQTFSISKRRKIMVIEQVLKNLENNYN